MISQSDFSEAIQVTKDGVILDIIVRPKSKYSGLEGYEKWRKKIEIRLTSRPVQGQANEELISIISKFFGLKNSDVIIISGTKSVNKRILLKDADFESIKATLECNLK